MFLEKGRVAVGFPARKQRLGIFPRDVAQLVRVVGRRPINHFANTIGSEAFSNIGAKPANSLPTIS
jgi:hypothetical protein